MIDLTQSVTASPRMHTVPRDPGESWISESVVVDVPPDDTSDPAPEAQWSAESVRT